METWTDLVARYLRLVGYTDARFTDLMQNRLAVALNTTEAMHVALANRPTKAKRTIGNCKRCSGTGYLPCYRHVSDGVCFACDGRGSK